MVEVSTSVLSVKDIKTIYNLEVAGTDYFHIDIMDGKFVENNNADEMLNFAREIRNITNLPLDVHLMVEDVEEYIEDVVTLNPNIITFHYEADTNTDIIMKRIKLIKENNVRVGLSINPKTQIESIFEFLPYIHIALIMTVEPGKGGQKLIESTIDKVKMIKKIIDDNDLDVDIECDGGINTENIAILKENGANLVVAGSSIIKSDDYKMVIEKMKNE